MVVRAGSSPPLERRAPPLVHRTRVGLLAALFGAAACSSEAPPSRGTYTVQFPSTAAAIATDYVQLFVFDVDDANRSGICDEVVAARASGRPRDPTLTHPAVNVCEMLAGRKPVTISYGEKAILAVAQRRTRTGAVEDLLAGCAVMAIGEGDAPEAIPLRFTDASAPLPPTTCASVADFCASKCQ